MHVLWIGYEQIGLSREFKKMSPIDSPTKHNVIHSEKQRNYLIYMT